MRTVPLRRRLVLLAAAGMVPLAAMSGIALLALTKQHRDQTERAVLELTRALATAVDAELQRSVSVLEGLSIAPSLDNGDLKRFQSAAQRVAETMPTWFTIILFDRAGRQLVNTRFPFGADLPPIVERESFDRLLKTRSPVIGHLAPGPGGMIAVPVRVPVVRNGELRYVLTAAVTPEGVLQVINRQRVPPEWVVSVFDARNMRIARSRAHEQYLGTPAAPSLQKLMASRAAEGTGLTYVLEGDAVYSAYSRLPGSNWSVATAIPVAAVNAAAYRSLAVYGGGLLLSIVVAVIAAFLIASSINAPIGELSRAARALGRGERPEVPRTPVQELRDVGEALAAAGHEIAQGEAEREQLLRREQDARAAAEAANRAKDEFLAMLGHELRNPLGAIANASRLLEHPEAPPESTRYAREIIARQVDHLARLTDDLLDAGRAVMGKIVLQRQPLELAELTRRTLATLTAAGRTEHHRIREHLEPAWVDADPTRLEQIITNLVVNAVKYTPAGGNISVAVAHEAGEAVLRVSDDGIGMSPELAARAFELFVQGDPGLDRARGGLGIGLTLVKRLAELHGGSAAAYSAGPQRGSEFTVRLPAAAKPAVAAVQPGSAALKPREILIVEDNDDARESLRSLLELNGHHVRMQSDGVGGLQTALAERPEVLLIDIGLPRMDGYELARRVRAAANGWRPYLIAVTGYGLPEDRARALGAGFDAHLPKPVDPSALEDLLRRI